MEEGQIARWVKNEGDAFEANETLAEVDTDKATMEMTALSGGTLLKILKPAGDTAALGEAIAIIGQKGEDISALLDEVSKNGASKAADEKPKSVSEPEPTAGGKAAEPTEEVRKDAPAATPAANSYGGRTIVPPIAAGWPRIMARPDDRRFRPTRPHSQTRH